MKLWFGIIAAGISILMTVGGCQEAKKETPGKVTASVSKGAEQPQPKALAGSAEETNLSSVTPPVPKASDSQPTPVPTAPKPVGPQPQIKFERTVFDLKDMKPDSKNTATYTFTNAGKGVLKITDVVKTCGCTVPELTKHDYEPGESGTIKVEYSASKVAGEVSKHLFVLSNDPNNPKVEIMLKGKIVLKVGVEPAAVTLSLYAPDANMPSITIFSKDNKPFAIKSIESSGNVASADFDPNVSATKFVIKPRIDMEKLKANLNGYIRFHITHPEIDMVNITYSAPAEYETQPAALIMRAATPLKMEEREVWIKNNYNRPFEIESITSKNGYIKVASQEKLDNLYKLKLEITPPELQKIMFFSDMLTIHIKGGPSLDMMCRGFYKR